MAHLEIDTNDLSLLSNDINEMNVKIDDLKSIINTKFDKIKELDFYSAGFKSISNYLESQVNKMQEFKGKLEKYQNQIIDIEKAYSGYFNDLVVPNLQSTSANLTVINPISIASDSVIETLIVTETTAPINPQEDIPVVTETTAPIDPQEDTPVVTETTAPINPEIETTIVSETTSNNTNQGSTNKVTSSTNKNSGYVNNQSVGANTNESNKTDAKTTQSNNQVEPIVNEDKKEIDKESSNSGLSGLGILAGVAGIVGAGGLAAHAVMKSKDEEDEEKNKENYMVREV